MSLSHEAKEALRHRTSRADVKLGMVFTSAIRGVGRRLRDDVTGFIEAVAKKWTGYTASERRERRIHPPQPYEANHDGESYSAGWAKKNLTSKGSVALQRMWDKARTTYSNSN